MVAAVREGNSLRAVALRFGVSLSTVAFWVDRAGHSRLDRVDFVDRKPGRASNRVSARWERLVLRSRQRLLTSVLGEYGAQAIWRDLSVRHPDEDVPSRATIHRVLVRHGLLDAVHRQRRPAPPKGWYLPEVASGKAELDSFDFVEGLKIADGPLVSVLTATSLHGALAQAWPTARPTARFTVERLLERWHQDGLPEFAQFDNDSIFQGTHRFADSIGRVIRLCLALGVTPVFAPPREPGFQNAIEGFNALWQAKVWRRHQFTGIEHLRRLSRAYIDAYREKTASRADAAPDRRAIAEEFRLDLHAPLRGRVIFLRRTNDNGRVHVLGRNFPVDSHWIRRLVRCEVDFTLQQICFYALRRRDPEDQPLLRQVRYVRADRPFQGPSQVFDER